MRPAGERDVGGGEGGGDEERHGRDDGAADDAGLAGVQDQAQAPDREAGGDAVGGPAEGAVQRVGEGGADEAEGVPRGLVGGAEEARVVGRVGPDHRRGERGETEEQEPDQLGAAAAERDLGVALHQRRAALALALSHSIRPFPG